MRTRFLEPSWFHDPALLSVSPVVRWFYLGLRCAADRDGRLEDAPGRLGIQLLPLDGGPAAAESAIRELIRAGLVNRCETGSTHVLCLRGWAEKVHPKERAGRFAAHTCTENKGVSANRIDLGLDVSDLDRKFHTASDSVSDSASTSASKNIPAPPPARPATSSWSRDACDDWIARFKGTAPGGQIGKALKRLVGAHGWETVRPAWQRYLAETEADYASPARFASTFGTWAGTAATVTRRSPARGPAPAARFRAGTYAPTEED